MSEYEEQQQQRIAQNRAKMESLGLSQIATTYFKSATQNTRNNKKTKKKIEKDKGEYRPECEELDQLDSSSADESDKVEEFINKDSSESLKRKVNFVGYLKFVNIFVIFH